MADHISNSIRSATVGTAVQANEIAGGVHIHQAAPSLKVLPRNLPAAPRWLVARDRELSRLNTALGETPIFTIEGVGGVGKTTLALHWLHQNAERFEDGQLYADLRGFTSGSPPLSPMSVAHGFLLALGVEPAAIPNDQDARMGLYRSMLAGRRSVILLDNAVDTAQVEPLLPGSRTCRVIVTSRNRLAALHSRGAGCMRLDVLAEDGARDLLKRYLGERVVDDDPAAIAAVVERCAGLPLALAIVAARASAHPEFPISAIVNELHEYTNRLDAFDTDEESTNLRSVMSWSYLALEPSAARLYRLISLIPIPDVSVPAMASLACLPVDRTATLMRGLERANLMRQNTPGRFLMHGIVRLHASEMAEQHESDRTRQEAVRRIVDFHVHAANSADHVLYPHRTPVRLADPAPGCIRLEFDSDAKAVAWFADEHQHTMAFQRVAIEFGWFAQAWQLARGLDTFHYRRGLLSDNVQASRLAVTAAEELHDSDTRLLAYRQLGRALTRAGCPDEALKWLRKALELSLSTASLQEQAHTLHDLARVAGSLGDHEHAVAHSTLALDLYRRLGNAIGEAHVLNALGWYHAESGQYEAARTLCRSALSAHEQLGNVNGRVIALDSLGSIELRTGHFALAISSYDEALKLCRELGNTFFEGTVVENLATAHSANGDLVRARGAWRVAHDLYLAQRRMADAARVEQRLHHGGVQSN